METFTIKKEVKIMAPVDDVFFALTNSEEITKYFPLNSVESEWKEGKEVKYKGEVNGSPFTDYGVIEVLSPPSIYRYRYWSDNHGTERTEDNHLVIEYVLTPFSEGTSVYVIQSNIKSKALYEMMEGQVWGYLLGSLKQYMENRT
ncbi:MAG: SRPBCC domain-containing protein [Gammaproteobacteria bacterium]|nr:SRPBCC domain-containing protein [Gammaproteobacteria bacterium]